MERHHDLRSGSSGKTEICLEIIKQCIQNKLTVGFAVPRRSVCVELKNRFQSIFTKNYVVAVYGGHHDVINGDIICLTTHQLFRYKAYFDLLIMDEIDAFPYKGNDVLEQMFINSVRGHHVLLSATPSKNLIKEYPDRAELYENLARVYIAEEKFDEAKEIDGNYHINKRLGEKGLLRSGGKGHYFVHAADRDHC